MHKFNWMGKKKLSKGCCHSSENTVNWQHALAGKNHMQFWWVAATAQKNSQICMCHWQCLVTSLPCSVTMYNSFDDPDSKKRDETSPNKKLHLGMSYCGSIWKWIDAACLPCWKVTIPCCTWNMWHGNTGQQAECFSNVCFAYQVLMPVIATKKKHTHTQLCETCMGSNQLGCPVRSGVNCLIIPCMRWPWTIITSEHHPGLMNGILKTCCSDGQWKVVSVSLTWAASNKWKEPQDWINQGG